MLSQIAPLWETIDRKEKDVEGQREGAGAVADRSIPFRTINSTPAPQALPSF